MLYCKKCGAQLPDVSKDCPNCGVHISNIELKKGESKNSDQQDESKDRHNNNPKIETNSHQYDFLDHFDTSVHERMLLDFRETNRTISRKTEELCELYRQQRERENKRKEFEYKLAKYFFILCGIIMLIILLIN